MINNENTIKVIKGSNNDNFLIKHLLYLKYYI